MFDIDTRNLAVEIRLQSLKMVHEAKASHIGSALSISDILAVLYGKVMRYEPTDPVWCNRDRFILSKGHACVAAYSALAECGFMPRKMLDEYGKDFSPLMNHISHRIPGVEFSTGSLGHGLPFAVGKALAGSKMAGAWRVFCLLSDGELAEGSNWEAMLFGAHHRLGNLCAIVDYNKLQSLTSVQNTLGLEPLVDKVRAFGWRVVEVDGHDHDELSGALAKTELDPAMPTLVVAHTIKGKGVSFMENKVEWHYKSPSKSAYESAIKEIRQGV